MLTVLGLFSGYIDTKQDGGTEDFTPPKLSNSSLVIYRKYNLNQYGYILHQNYLLDMVFYVERASSLLLVQAVDYQVSILYSHMKDQV